MNKLIETKTKTKNANVNRPIEPFPNMITKTERGENFVIQSIRTV